MSCMMIYLNRRDFILVHTSNLYSLVMYGSNNFRKVNLTPRHQ